MHLAIQSGRLEGIEALHSSRDLGYWLRERQGARSRPEHARTMGSDRLSGTAAIRSHAERACRKSACGERLGRQPGLFTLGSSTLGGPDVLAGPDLPVELHQILFPTARLLTDNQRHDIEHLRLHVRTGGDIFVTLNANDFITRGRQETLRSFGTWVLSPKELLGLLRELHGWQ